MFEFYRELALNVLEEVLKYDGVQSGNRTSPNRNDYVGQFVISGHALSIWCGAIRNSNQDEFLLILERNYNKDWNTNLTMWTRTEFHSPDLVSQLAKEVYEFSMVFLSLPIL